MDMKKSREIRKLAVKALSEITCLTVKAKLNDTEYVYFLCALQQQISNDILNFVGEDIRNGIYKERCESNEENL